MHVEHLPSYWVNIKLELATVVDVALAERAGRAVLARVRHTLACRPGAGAAVGRGGRIATLANQFFTNDDARFWVNDRLDHAVLGRRLLRAVRARAVIACCNRAALANLEQLLEGVLSLLLSLILGLLGSKRSLLELLATLGLDTRRCIDSGLYHGLSLRILRL